MAVKISDSERLMNQLRLFFEAVRAHERVPEMFGQEYDEMIRRRTELEVLYGELKLGE